jgi:adenylate cyclase
MSSNDEMWRNLLEGTDPELTRLQRLFRRIPNAPRCKLCNAPFRAPGSLLVRPLGWGRWATNPTLCRICARGLDKVKGGAEVEATFLFADIRGSTGLAERLRPTEFQALLDRFYLICAEAIDEGGGLLDKYLGDGVVGLFVPVFSRQGNNPAAGAIRAGRTILERVTERSTGRDAIPVGVGIHSGLAYVGIMGTEGGQLDFTGVGDTVDTAARLGSVADSGELLVSLAAAGHAGLDGAGLEHRSLTLKGREVMVEVVVLRAEPASADSEPEAVA